jgi:hypothetical protein
MQVQIFPRNPLQDLSVIRSLSARGDDSMAKDPRPFSIGIASALILNQPAGKTASRLKVLIKLTRTCFTLINLILFSANQFK